MSVSILDRISALADPTRSRILLLLDGREMEFGPGDVSWLPPGHDAWVVGDEPVVVIDISGMGQYAKPR